MAAGSQRTAISRLGRSKAARSFLDIPRGAGFAVRSDSGSPPRDAVFSAASSCALFFLALRFMKRFWAFMAAALFTLLSADPFAQGTAANTEVFMLLPLVLSQIALLKAADNPRNVLLMIGCGALTGIAIAFKQVAAVNFFLLIALYPIFAAADKRWRN